MTSSGRSYASLLLVGVFLGCCAQAHAIPAFARKYGLPCSACHEAWPKLNSFGQNFKDNGYQLMNDRDAPIYQNASYWPVAMRITPHWHYESSSNIPIDVAGGTQDQTVKTSGFDLTGIDILTAGTLANNISFLLVPSIDPGDGTVGFESANVRLDNLWHSPWLNFKFGKFELDLPLSEKRMMTLSNIGGIYQLYHFAPAGDAVNDEVASFGENQLGVELMGHSKDDHTRYALSLMSSTNGAPGLLGGRSYDGYAHVSQGFLVPHLGLQRVGAYGWVGQRSTYFLTSGGGRTARHRPWQPVILADWGIRQLVLRKVRCDHGLPVRDGQSISSERRSGQPASPHGRPGAEVEYRDHRGALRLFASVVFYRPLRTGTHDAAGAGRTAGRFGEHRCVYHRLPLLPVHA